MILGDSPQAAVKGLKSDQMPAGGYEIRTLREHVLIVGDAAGVLRGVDAFLARAPNYVPKGSTKTGTDLIVAPLALDGRPG